MGLAATLAPLFLFKIHSNAIMPFVPFGFDGFLSMHTLVARNLSKSYLQGGQHNQVLRSVNYTFQAGHTYAISGVSGTGKSTLVHLLAGLDAPTDGQVLFEGRDIAAFDATERSHFLNQSMGLVFQAPYLIKELSVLENVMLKGLIAHGNHAACVAEAMQLLASFGLSDKAHAYPADLSGGQQQRVAIARAFFGKPAFLLADEPTGNLDAATTDAVLDVLAQNGQLGLIVTSHNERVCARMGTHLRLENGELVSVSR